MKQRAKGRELTSTPVTPEASDETGAPKQVLKIDSTKTTGVKVLVKTPCFKKHCEHSVFACFFFSHEI